MEAVARIYFGIDLPEEPEAALSKLDLLRSGETLSMFSGIEAANSRLSRGLNLNHYGAYDYRVWTIAVVLNPEDYDARCWDQQATFSISEEQSELLPVLPEIPPDLVAALGEYANTLGICGPAWRWGVEPL